MRTFDVKLPIQAHDEKEATQLQQALHTISRQFTPDQLILIAQRLKNPIVKAAVIQKLT
jgi:hypothetical protein